MDSGIRWLMLLATGSALTCLNHATLTSADDSTGSGDQKDSSWTIRIVSADQSVQKTVAVSISAASPETAQNGMPILISPTYSAALADRSSANRKQDDSAPEKPKKNAPKVAHETASQKALEAWQKRDSSTRRQTRPGGKTEGRQASSSSVKQQPGKGGTATSQKQAFKAGKRPATTGHNIQMYSGPRAGEQSPISNLRDARTYREIYESIPFSRAEYDANPAYRHQATMELMLGQLHPIIVAPAAPPQPPQNVTIRFLPIVRSGYRVWSKYPWH